MLFSLYKCVDCLANELVHSSECILICTWLKVLFSKIHLTGQVLMSVPGVRHHFQLLKKSHCGCIIWLKNPFISVFYS